MTNIDDLVSKLIKAITNNCAKMSEVIESEALKMEFTKILTDPSWTNINENRKLDHYKLLVEWLKCYKNESDVIMGSIRPLLDEAERLENTND